jgi:lipopolysaccharide export system permease protein
MLGAAATAIMFIANESVIPWSNRYSEYIQNVEIAKKPDTVYFKRDQIWMRVPDAIIQIGRFDKNTQSLERVTVITVDSEFNMVERLFADRAKWWGDHWIMYGVNRTYRIEPGRYGVETLPSLPAPFYKAPKDFDRVESPTKEMNLSQLGDYIEKLTAEGQSPVRHLTDWHDKIAFPFVCLIMAALGIPFAIRMHPRSGGVAVGLGLSLLTAFGWWITHTFFIALGHGGYIPPALAAWGPNAIFGFSALYLILSAGA